MNVSIKKDDMVSEGVNLIIKMRKTVKERCDNYIKKEDVSLCTYES